MKILYFLLIASLTYISAGAQNVDLKLNLGKGKDYRQILQSEVSVHQDYNGQNINIDMVIKGNVVYHVDSVDQRGFNMTAQYENLSMVMNLPQGTVEFNSEINNVNDALSTFLNGMTHTPFYIAMDKRGKVLEVKMDGVWESLLNHLGDLTMEQKEQLLAQVKSSYGDKAIKGNMEMTSAIYPDKPVNKGDKWTIDTELQSNMSAKMTTEYVFEDLTPEYAIVKGNSIITTPNDNFIESNGMNVRYDLSGSMLSDLKVDLSSGWVLESKITQELKGEIHFKENEMVVPIVMTNKMTITSN